jgi:hypothetical protein
MQDANPTKVGVDQRFVFAVEKHGPWATAGYGRAIRGR